MTYQIIVKPWALAREMATPVRFEVFVNEQKVPESMELDDDDGHAWHALVMTASEVIGTARLVVEGEPNHKVGRIGRMAILKNYRRNGIGAELLKTLIKFGIERGINEYYLHAQLSAQEFYKMMGFFSEGEIFEEAGILHQSMRYKNIINA